jgi:hypothetical protein
MMNVVRKILKIKKKELADFFCVGRSHRKVAPSLLLNLTSEKENNKYHS